MKARPQGRSRSAAILSLVRPSNEETSCCLRAIASRNDNGRVRGGVVVFFESDDGTKNIVFTGKYKTSHAEAVKAAASMTWRLMQVDADGEW